MLELIGWVTENTDYKYNNEPLPEVLFVTPEDLNILYYGHFKEDSTEIYGIYDYRIDTMFLRKDFDVNKQKDILLHELIHYMQDINGTLNEDSCKGDNEFEAYSLTADWQEEYNYTPSVEVNQLFIFMMAASCQRFDR